MVLFIKNIIIAPSLLSTPLTIPTFWSKLPPFPPAPMENVDVLDRVKEELKQLEIKKQKLTEFITSEKFTTLSEMHKFLLQKQLEVQILYIAILEQRLALFESEKEN